MYAVVEQNYTCNFPGEHVVRHLALPWELSRSLHMLLQHQQTRNALNNL